MGYDCLLDFTAFCQLIRHTGLIIRFLCVRLHVRYCFLSPTPRGVNLASRYGVRRQLRPLWTFTTVRRHARHTKKRLLLQGASLLSLHLLLHGLLTSPEFLFEYRSDSSPSGRSWPKDIRKGHILSKTISLLCCAFLHLKKVILRPHPGASSRQTRP